MKYYVLQATREREQEIDAIAVTQKDNEKEARMLFHQILASAYANENLEFLMAQITNEWGGVVDSEEWHEPQV